MATILANQGSSLRLHPSRRAGHSLHSYVKYKDLASIWPLGLPCRAWTLINQPTSTLPLRPSHSRLRLPQLILGVKPRASTSVPVLLATRFHTITRVSGSAATMSPNKNAAITSYFKPKDGEPDKPRPKDSSDDITEEPRAPTPSTPQDKPKAKRRASTSPASPPSKRQDTKTLTPPPPPPSPKPLSYKDLPTTDTAIPSSPAPKTLDLTLRTGSLFDAPPGTLLLHACNTQGSWGAGIALAFKQQYPKAYAIYHDFCTTEHSFKGGNPVPVGTTLLIPPVDGAEGHWIGCLFTSRQYGKRKDSVAEILQNTGRAMEACLALAQLAGEQAISGVRMCRINSGKFGVPWLRTEVVLRGIVVREGWIDRVEVWNPKDA